MKKLIYLLFALSFIAGCASAEWTEAKARYAQANADYDRGKISFQEYREEAAHMRLANDRRMNMMAPFLLPMIATGSAMGAGTPGHGRVHTRTVPTSDGGYTIMYSIYP